MQDALAATTLRELLFLLDLGTQWCQLQLSEDQYAQLGLQRQRWDAVLELVPRIFFEKQFRILGRTPGRIQTPDEPRPSGVFSIFDQFQEDYVYEMPEEV